MPKKMTLFFILLWITSLCPCFASIASLYLSDNAAMLSFALQNMVRLICLIYLCAVTFPFKYPKIKSNINILTIIKSIILTAIFLTSFSFAGGLAAEFTNYNYINKISSSELITYFLKLFILDSIHIIIFTILVFTLYLIKKLFMHLIVKSRLGG